MNAATQGVLMLGAGFAVGRLVLTDSYLNYVRPSMRLWLILAAGLLLAIGLATFVRGMRNAKQDDHGHDHPMTRAAWLVILPAIALVLLPSDPLGAFAANRKATRQPAQPGSVTFDKLPSPVDGAVELTFSEFVDRAFLDEDRSLEDVRVRLTGFVTPAEGGDASFGLTRFAMTCCAADAYPVQVDVYGAQPPPVDSWLTVTGTWRVPDHEVKPYGELVELEAEDVKRVERPENPYEGG